MLRGQQPRGSRPPPLPRRLPAPQNAPAVPQWAVDINALLGGTSSPPSATYVDPNALLVTGVAADPASGIRILSGTEGAAAAAASASAHSYIWTGPVSAGADTLPFVQAHPYSAVALREQRRRRGGGGGA